MCSFDAHEKKHPSSFGGGSSGGGYVLPSNSTTEALVSLSETINFTDCWLQGLQDNLLDTWSSPKFPLCSHSLVCIENHLFIVGIGPILDKELKLIFRSDRSDRTCVYI